MLLGDRANAGTLKKEQGRQTGSDTVTETWAA